MEYSADMIWPEQPDPISHMLYALIRIPYLGPICT